MILHKLQPKRQKQIIWILFISAQAASLLSRALEQIDYDRIYPWLSRDALDWVVGFLIGYSIVGFLAFLACSGKILVNDSKGQASI